MEDLVKKLLRQIGEDPKRPGLRETPKLWSEAFAALTAGYKQNPEGVLRDALLPAETQGLIMLRDIEFSSLCEHHLLPFLGVVHVGYLPGKHMIGLGKIARVVDLFARRLQTQERLTEEICAALERALAPRGIGILVEALHCCMAVRGPLQRQSRVTTTVFRGVLESDAALRREFLGSLGHPAGVEE